MTPKPSAGAPRCCTPASTSNTRDRSARALGRCNTSTPGSIPPCQRPSAALRPTSTRTGERFSSGWRLMRSLTGSAARWIGNASTCGNLPFSRCLNSPSKDRRSISSSLRRSAAPFARSQVLAGAVASPWSSACLGLETSWRYRASRPGLPCRQRSTSPSTRFGNTVLSTRWTHRIFIGNSCSSIVHAELSLVGCSIPSAFSLDARSGPTAAGGGRGAVGGPGIPPRVPPATNLTQVDHSPTFPHLRDVALLVVGESACGNFQNHFSNREGA